jgi:hypothetical protein
VSLGASGLSDLPCRRARTRFLSGHPSRAGAGADQPAASGARETSGAARVDGAAGSVASERAAGSEASQHPAGSARSEHGGQRARRGYPRCAAVRATKSRSASVKAGESCGL